MSGQYIKRYYPPLSDLISLSALDGTALEFVKEALLTVFSKLFYKDLQFTRSAEGKGFYKLSVVSNAQIAFNIPGTEVSIIINKDDLDPGISSFPLTLEYEWIALAIVKTLTSQSLPAALNEVVLLAQKLYQIDDSRLLLQAIKQYKDYNSFQNEYEQIATHLNSVYGTNLVAPPATSITPLNDFMLQVQDEILNIQNKSLIEVLLQVFMQDNDPETAWNNIIQYFRGIIKRDVREDIKKLLIPKIKTALTITGHLAVPRKWLTPLDINDEPLPVSSSPSAEIEEPRASFQFSKVDLIADSQSGFGLQADFSISLSDAVMVGKTGLIIRSFNNLKLDLRDDHNIPEMDLDGRSQAFKGIFLEECEIEFPKNWSFSSSSLSMSNPKIIAKNLIVGNQEGVSGIFSVEGANREKYIPFKVSNLSQLTLDIINQQIIATGDIPTNTYILNYVPGEEIYIRDFNNSYYHLATSGALTKVNSAAPAAILVYTFANGMTISLDSFYLHFNRNKVIESAVVGTISGNNFAPIKITVEFEDGFLIRAYIPNGQPLFNNNTIEIKLNGLEFGKTNDQWQFGIAGRVDIKKAAPFIDRFLPTYFQLYRLFYSGATGFSYDLEAGWKNGMVVRGDDVNGIAAYIPINLGADSNSSGFKLKGINFKIKANPNPEIEALMSGAGLVIGPVSAFVEDFGVKLAINETSEANADFGGVSTAISFVGPRGIEINIDAGPVSGSGFLYIGDNEYYGAFTLSFSKFGMGIVGILTTQLPGGKAGYSLLMIVSANFGSIPIGMGFTLNGLGGLLGLHRTMNPDVLRTGVRDNTLDYILFPQKVDKQNIKSVISNIGQAFPVMEGQFVVGPMAKIGWGTPTLITIELGIILEFPEPVRLAILGVLRAILPSEDKAVLKLQINFLGIIDFTAKYLSFDASIYDSKILTFPLMGDMALRLYWGDKPNFLMSVGGFHPRYTPPPLNLPELRRLSLKLANDKNFSIGVEAYFAVSSNSVQFGAKVAAEARMWDGKINVLGALWFDILFKFNPFYFAADMGAQFTVRWKSKELLSIFINLMLEGPNPWRAQGKGTFKVIGIGVTVSFDKTFGKVVAETIAPVGLDDKFAEQLTHKDNWEALLPPRSHQQILWKEAAADEGLIVDTGGQLRFSQKLLPLNIDMARFGTAPISDTKRFEITAYKLVQSGQTEPFNTPAPVKDLFARSEYFNMTDDDKLSKDPYESFESGVFIGSDKISSDYAVHRKVEYEDIVIDTGFREEKTNKWSLAPELMQVHLLDSYVSKSALSDFTAVGNNAGPKKVAAVNIVEERFVVVDSNNLNIVSQVFTSSAEADSFLNAQMQSNSIANGWFVANEFELV